MPNRVALLHDLLVSLFGADDLRRWIRHDSDLTSIFASLPSQGASTTAVVDAAITAMEQQGLIDRALFMRLISAFPRRADDIRRVALDYGHSIEAPSTERTHDERGVRTNPIEPGVVPPRPSAGRSIAEWISTVGLIATTGLFYYSSVGRACSNVDLLALSALTGFPLAIFLILRRQPFRIAWVVAPILSFFIGMPYGHNHGEMSQSRLFGLKQGTACQSSPEILIFLMVLLVGAAVDQAVFLRARKQT